jgi:pyrroline-5-carboxylate reductase
MNDSRIVFIGGGNMASALVGGLVKAGADGDRLTVIDPDEGSRTRLSQHFGVHTLAPYIGSALQLSVMAGIRSDAIARASGSTRVVRTMPNTPALIGQGITGVFATTHVTLPDRAWVESVLRPTGELCWVDREADLDAVTALSGSGPAYVFYFVEAMMQAALEMGLSEAQGRQLALATFAGATALAQRSDEPPSVLRERVTSKGGTTYAALTAMEAAGMKQAFVAALKAAQARAKELGDEFGR